MTGEIHRLRERQGDSEKITINLGFVDLGHVDLLVREGFYSNRTDFIRTAIRNQLASHTDAVKQSIVRHTGCDSTLCGVWSGFGERGKRDYGDDETE